MFTRVTDEPKSVFFLDASDHFRSVMEFSSASAARDLYAGSDLWQGPPQPRG
jgi:hypothetical protein